jgi:hypothetical protein
MRVMQSQYRGFTIHVSASLVDGDIVGYARIYGPQGNEFVTEDVHEMEFHLAFVDEHEAMALARECAVAWVDEH